MAFTGTRKDALSYSNVQTAKKDLDNNSIYKQSDAVTNAYNLRDQHAANTIGEWTGGTYADSVNKALENITNRKAFSYDLNGDALYQQYKDQYMGLGKLAMADTIGQASAMTGGYGNSYAATAGNQAYQSYLTQLNDIVPDLYKMALDKYNSEGDDLKDIYSLYKNQQDTEYGQYQDNLTQWNTEQARLDTNAYNEANLDYSKFSDNRSFYNDVYNTALNWATNDANTDYNNRFTNYQQGVAEDQWSKDYAFKQQQQAASEAQWAKEYALSQQQLAMQKANNDQSSKIAALQGQLSQYQDDAKIKPVQSENTQLLKASVMTKSEFGRYSKKSQYGSYDNYLASEIVKWTDNGQLSEGEAKWLSDYYGLSK